jgi:uncharacterized protein (TIGR00725 family)
LPAIITVFGSSRPAPGSPAYETARALGAALARTGFAVATGGYGGTMEAASRGAREARLPDGQAGGKVIGVTAEEFSSPANQWVEEEIRVKTWQDRLMKLVELGAGYVALPGGTGTLVELPVVNAIPAAELNSNPIQQVASVEEAVKLLLQRVGDPRQAAD